MSGAILRPSRRVLRLTASFVALIGFSSANATLAKSAAQASKVSAAGAVLVVTVELLGEQDAWPDGEFPQTWSDAAEAIDGEWWVGTGALGSNDPVRSLYGLLSGVSPLRIGSIADMRKGDANQLSLPVKMAGNGHLTGGRVAGFLGGWRTLRKIAPGVEPLLKFRRAVRELAAMEGPSFYWLALSRSPRGRGEGLTSSVRRILDALKREQLLSRTMIVVTSVHGTDEKVPLAVLFPRLRDECERGSCEAVRMVDSAVPLEVVGSTLREHLSYAGGPTMAPDWVSLESDGAARGTIFRREYRKNDVLEGFSVARGGSKVSVRWAPGEMESCWHRNHPSCRWSTVNPTDAPETVDADDQLESALLLELEKILARVPRGAAL